MTRSKVVFRAQFSFGDISVLGCRIEVDSSLISPSSRVIVFCWQRSRTLRTYVRRGETKDPRLFLDRKTRVDSVQEESWQGKGHAGPPKVEEILDE